MLRWPWFLSPMSKTFMCTSPSHSAVAGLWLSSGSQPYQGQFTWPSTLTFGWLTVPLLFWFTASSTCGEEGSLPLTRNTEYNESQSLIMTLLSTCRQTQLTQPSGFLRTSCSPTVYFPQPKTYLPWCYASPSQWWAGCVYPDFFSLILTTSKQDLKKKLSPSCIYLQDSTQSTVLKLYSIYQCTSRISIYHCSFNDGQVRKLAHLKLRAVLN